MEPKALVYQNWDELIFENRNKEYGAYAIRRSYNDKVLLGMGVSILLMAILLTLPQLYPQVKVIPDIPVIKDDGPIMVEYVQPKKEEPVRRNEPPITRRTDTTPLVTTAQVIEDPIVDQPVVEPSSTTGIGDGSVNVTGSSVRAIEEPPIVSDPPTEWLNPEVMPSYKGGYEAMVQFLRQNLRYPAAARRMGIEGTVFVSFLVLGDGKVADVKVLRGIHPQCDDEAVRIISRLSGWIGGKQGGMPVSVRMVLPVKFKLN